MKLVEHLGLLFENIKGIRFLIAILFIFFLLRLPSLFEPYWYGDEGIYQTIGIAINDGKLLYRDIWDNKPPLLYLIYAFFSSDQFAVKSVNLIFGIFSVLAFYILAKLIFNKQRLVYILTSLFAVFFGLPALEGNIANAENFMLLPIILSGILIYKASNYTLDAKRYTLFTVGFLLSLAFLTKAVAIFDFLAFLIFLKLVKKSFRDLFPFIVSFIAPIIVVALYFLTQGAFIDFFNAAFLQNIGYVGYENKFFVDQGFLLLKVALLTLGIILIFRKRRLFTKELLFLTLWFLFSLFNAFFSQRPYTHYLLVLLPSFLLLSGFIFDKTLSGKFSQKIALALIIPSSILIIFNFWIYLKTPTYYVNFVSFITMQKSVYEYRQFFDKNTPRDYQLAQFINARLRGEKTIFIWGDNAQLYKLTDTIPPGRYTVAYHINDNQEALAETEKALKKKAPRFIIANLNQQEIPFSMERYRQRIIIEDTVIYERIF